MELLQKLLDRAGITEWDILLIGDGSGSGWEGPCGWAATLIDQQTRDRKFFFGANNFGSVNLAEVMPYLIAMSWFHHTHGKARLRQRAPLRVHIITDSQVTANHGTKVARHELPTVGHRHLWAAMHELGALGYQIEYHWAPRSDSLLNWASDLLAGLARREVKHLDQATRAAGFDGRLAEHVSDLIGRLHFVDPLDGATISTYDLNPAEETDDGNSAPSQNL